MKVLKLVFCLINICSVENYPVSQYKLPPANKPHILFFTGGNSLMPGGIYTQFIEKLKNENDVTVITNRLQKNNAAITPLYFFNNFDNNDDNNNFDEEFGITQQIIDICNIKYEAVQNLELIALGHSSGCSTLINYCSKFANIKKCILIDPVNNKGNKLKKPNFDKTLIIKAEKSYKWSFEKNNPFPKKAPFIPAFEMKSDIFNNPNIITMNNYGHCDILDPFWSDIMHKSFAEGNDDRDSIGEYKSELVSIINNFINDTNTENYK